MTRKGARSYYPLFRTVAQTGQVLDVLHRSGNVHDSNGAACAGGSAWSSDRGTNGQRLLWRGRIIRKLDALELEYALSVPFEGVQQLKRMVEQYMGNYPDAA